MKKMLAALAAVCMGFAAVSAYAKPGDVYVCVEVGNGKLVCKKVPGGSTGAP